MDRLTLPAVRIPPGLRTLALFLFLLLALLACKAIDSGWLIPCAPLELNDQLALLFFIRHKGCQCELVVYQAAEEQIRNWDEAERQGVPVLPVDLDRCPNLGKQYQVIRSPSLLLVDAEGNVLLRQSDSISDAAPLDLAKFEQKLSEVFHGN